jgi:transcriptional regulator with XRE-family HTH domain
MAAKAATPLASEPAATGIANGLGADIRALRKARGLTLAELALRTGRSIGFLSQIERGLSEPAIGDLRQLAEIFEVPLGFFFMGAEADAADRGYVVRADRRRRLGNPEDGLIEALLSPDLGGRFEMFHAVFQPGAELPAEIRRASEEAGYVVSGRLDLWIGGKHFTLGPGDSFRFRDEPYRWRNPGDTEAVVIWVISPPVY